MEKRGERHGRHRTRSAAAGHGHEIDARRVLATLGNASGNHESRVKENRINIDPSSIIDATRRWLADFVIGLNLCPFARRVFEAGAIRYVVSAATDEVTLRNDLVDELLRLVETPINEIETTLLIHPGVLRDFLDYNDFLDVAEQTLDDLGLDGIVQIASFHPDYQFADTDAAAAENYTNRSPYPMLHLLREASVAAVAGDDAELLEIPKRNIQLLQSLGRESILERLRAIHGDQPS